MIHNHEVPGSIPGLATETVSYTHLGMMDCKKALTESDGDIEKAMEIIRKKGQAIAAKRSDRDAAEGCVLAKKDGEFAAIIALKCETDFVAKNEDFIDVYKRQIWT